MKETTNRRLNASEAAKVDSLIRSLLATTAPAFTLPELATRSASPVAQGFERYAAVALADAGAARLREFPLSTKLSLAVPGDGHLARIDATGSVDAQQKSAIIAVECALNRLVGIRDAISDGRTSDEPDASARRSPGLNLIGTYAVKPPAAHRSTHVLLPRIGKAEHAGQEYFNELDWRCLDNIASTAHAVFQRSVFRNPHQTIGTVCARDGGSWDVRTRLAAILESLEMPTTLPFSFDFDGERQTLYVHVGAPPRLGLPQRSLDDSNRLVKLTETMAHRAYRSFALRLACLAGAACFGSGKHVERACVAVSDPRDEMLLSCDFSRGNFVKGPLASIDAGTFSAAAFRFDPDGLSKLMGPCQLRFPEERNFAERGGLPFGLPSGVRVPVADDERPLPHSLVGVFHANRICDIDTKRYFGGHAEQVDRARCDSGDSALAAIARLEDTVEGFERTSTVPADDGVRPLYCGNALSRAAVSLLDDDLSVSAEAERFLNGGEADAGPERADVRYFRLPSALFHAHMGLSDLYQRIGDFKGADRHADICIAYAPTTASAYFRKADVLAERGRTAEAANVLTQGLRFAVSERDCSLLYYHLALLLWQLGQTEDALAVHAYTAHLNGDYREKAEKVVAALRKRHPGTPILFAGRQAITTELKRLGLPVAPNTTALGFAVRAAIELTDAGFPEASAPYADAIANLYAHDSVIVRACRSISKGLREP